MRPKVKRFTSKMRILPFPPNPKHTMKLKIETPIILGACLALIGTASADTIKWTGGGDGVSLFQEANWDAAGGTLIGDYIPKGPATTPHDLIVDSNNGTANSGIGGTNGWGGTLDLANVGSITVTNGTFRMSTTAVIKNGSANITGSNFGYIQGTLENVDFVSNGGLSLSGSLDILNGSSVLATWFAFGGTSDIGGASTLTIREDGAGSFNGTTLNFLDFESTIVYSNAGRTIAEVTSEHLSKFTVNGDAAVVGTNINIFTNGDGFTTVQAVPEPQTFVLLGGLVALTSVMLRRRTR
jgi:hypothetical protein